MIRNYSMNTIYYGICNAYFSLRVKKYSMFPRTYGIFRTNYGFYCTTTVVERATCTRVNIILRFLHFIL